MLTRVIRLVGLAVLFGASQTIAQAPLSAIDWLSDSLATPPSRLQDLPNNDVALTALPEDVSVSEISGPTADAVGLLPSSVTGLPRNLWGNSKSDSLARRIQANHDDMIPAMRDLLYKLLLAELDPPFDGGPETRLYLARLDTLLSMGALEQAQSLLQHSGQDRPDLFRRAFDVSLLLRVEDDACGTLRSTPALSPTFPARVFCLARGGDWDAAALSLETGRVLGFLSEEDDELLARFLDPILFEGEPRLKVPAHPSPLVFRMLEAIGEPISTSSLPRAFAHADIHANTGWKAQIEAAERLVRSGAVDPNRLLGLYSERRPAASGGVWERVKTIQVLDNALEKADLPAIEIALQQSWDVMAEAELEVAFATLFAHRISGLELSEPGAGLAFKIGLLSDGYETIANGFHAQTVRQRLLVSISRGEAGDTFAADPITAALQDGFRANGIPVRLQSLTSSHRLGEAILRAMDLFANGARGDLDELTDALAFFRAVGMEDVARRSALQLLLLERRG